MASGAQNARIVGRYALFDEIASGGMATVHLGRLLGPVGFSRTVAIKRLYPHFAKDPDFAAMFLDEARLAARVQHPNVVATFDVVALDAELFHVMEFVPGETLSRLVSVARASTEPLRVDVVAGIVVATLHGLHAAHEARSESGEPLGIVHRDVSPQNVMVGLDGIARVLDFGVAKAAGRSQVTRDGQIKGKLAYMPPEQIRGGAVDRRSDVYGAGVVLWEALTSRRLFDGESDAVILYKVTNAAPLPPPSTVVAGIPAALDAVVMRALAPDPDLRFPTARAMAEAIEVSVPLASPGQIASWVERVSGEHLARKIRRVKEIESRSVALASMLDAGALPREAPLALTEGAAASNSQISQVSAVSSSSKVGARSAPFAAASILAGVLALVVVVLVAFIKLHPATPLPAATPSDGEVIRQAPAPSLAPVSSQPMAAPSASIAALPVVASVQVAASVASDVAKPILVRPMGRPRSEDACLPPYTIDAHGIRRPKPECL